MALLESLQIPLGTQMPDFTLEDPEGRSFSNKDVMGKKGLLLVITCNHCPYAIAVWERLVRLADYARPLGINTVAINPNINPDYPDDAPEKMILKKKELGFSFPYLVDSTQNLARTLKAQCTPDIYLYDASAKLVYHGRIDDNWKEPEKVAKEELKEAIGALATGETISAKQMPSMGCSIKWRE